jgi:protein SCO1/2
MTRRTKWIVYLLFFVLLLGGFYYFLFRGTDNWKSKLPTIDYVKEFSFPNQDGKIVRNRDVEGKVYVANYFFTTCHGICPDLISHVKTVYEAYKNNADVKFLSFTCQPENDSVPILKHYADSLKINEKQWQFLTGNKLDLYKTARESFHIDDPKNNVGKIEDQFLHSQFLALIDKSGKVRGVYDGLKQSEMEKLKDDIDDVSKEKADKATFVNNIFNNNP